MDSFFDNYEKRHWTVNIKGYQGYALAVPRDLRLLTCCLWVTEKSFFFWIMLKGWALQILGLGAFGHLVFLLRAQPWLLLAYWYFFKALDYGSMPTSLSL